MGLLNMENKDLYTGEGVKFAPNTEISAVAYNDKESLKEYFEKQDGVYTPELLDIYAENTLSVVSKVKALQENEDIETSTFILYTDSHYTNDTVNFEFDRMQNAIEYINGATKADFVCNMGDTTNGEPGTDTTSVFKMLFGRISEKSYKYVNLVGNHDLYKPILQRKCLTNIKAACYAPKSSSFYLDDERNDTRYLFLSLHEKGAFLDSNTRLDISNYVGISYSQFKWLADVALKTNHKIVLISHETITRPTSGNQNWMSNPYSNYMKIKDLFNAFIDGTSGSITLTLQNDSVDAETSIAYDFTGQGKGKVFASFHGHIHGDADYDNGKWHEWWTESALYTQDVWAGTNAIKTRGTSTEVAFDTVVIDHTNKKVYMFRFGAGSDRVSE